MHCLWECKLVQPLWKTVMELPQKIKRYNYHTNQQFHFQEYTQRKENH